MSSDDQVLEKLRRLKELFPSDPGGPSMGMSRPPPLPATALVAADTRDLTVVPPAELLPRVLRRQTPAPMRHSVNRNILAGVASAGVLAAALCIYVLTPGSVSQPNVVTVAADTASVAAAHPEADTAPPLSTRLAEGMSRLRPATELTAADTTPPAIVTTVPNDAAAQTSVLVETAAAVAPAEQPVLAIPASDAAAVDLLQRGQQMMANGNIPAARLLLERATEAGSAEAALSLGNSYVAGSDGNVHLARRWYQRAAALGANEAPDKLRALER